MFRSAGVAAACAIALCSAEPQAHALRGDRAPTQYQRQQWKKADGLPRNTVLAMAQTPDGYLWLGTEGGLVRFDGDRFAVFTSANQPALASDVVLSLEAASDGTLWIGTRGGLTSAKNGAFIRYGDAEGVPAEGVSAIEEDREGRIWIGQRNRLLVGDFAGFEEFHDAGKRIVGQPSDVLAATDGSIWIACGRLFRVQAKELHGFSTTDGYGHPAQSLAEPRDGTIWIGTTKGIATFDSGSFRVLGKEYGLPQDVIKRITRDSDGNLWLATASSGLFRFDGEATEGLSTRNGFPSDQVLSLVEDDSGAIWAGTSGGGLVRMRDGLFAPSSVEEGLGERSIGPVFARSNGDLWIGTLRSLYRLRGRSVHTFGPDDGLPTAAILSLYEDSHGMMLVGTSEGVFRFGDGRFSRVANDPTAGGHIILAMTETADGAIWVATPSNLQRIVRDNVDVFDSSQKTAALLRLPGRPISLLPSRSGGLWIGTVSGLCHRRTEAMECFDSDDGVPEGMLLSMYEGESGELWIAAYGIGLIRFDGRRAVAITQEHGLPADDLYTVVEDSRGDLWVSSGQGVFRVAASDLAAIASAAKNRVDVRLYGENDGMRSSECNGGPQPSAVRGIDGQLYFATTDGIAALDPVNADRSPPPPGALIEGVSIDGQTVALPPSSATIAIPRGSERVEFHYTAPDFDAAQTLQFRHRLSGFDDEWVLAGTSRNASYTNLPPGTYQFSVAARHASGEWGNVASTSTLRKQPHFHQTLFFRLLVAAGILVLAFAVYRLRVSRLVARQAELTELVDYRTRDLKLAKKSLEEINETLEQRVNDGIDRLRAAERMAAYGQMVASVAHEVRQPVTAIQTASHILNDKLGEREDVAPQVGLLTRETERMQCIVEELLEFAKPPQLALTNVDVASLLEEARDAFSGSPDEDCLPVLIDVSGDIAVRADHNRIVQVVLNLFKNAQLHAKGATRVLVTATVEEPKENGGRVRVAVSDDGTGISPELIDTVFEPFVTAGRGTGLGLAIARRLVSAHTGTLSVESGPTGTCFEISLPLSGPQSASMEAGPTTNGPRVSC